jgi:hypothetical protein
MDRGLSSTEDSGLMHMQSRIGICGDQVGPHANAREDSQGYRLLELCITQLNIAQGY